VNRKIGLGIADQNKNKLLKEFSSGAKFSLVLIIALAALCSCAVAQEDAAGNTADWWIEKGNELFINGSHE